jgi:hypothetical protein
MHIQTGLDDLERGYFDEVDDDDLDGYLAALPAAPSRGTN